MKNKIAYIFSVLIIGSVTIFADPTTPTVIPREARISPDGKRVAMLTDKNSYSLVLASVLDEKSPGFLSLDGSRTVEGGPVEYLQRSELGSLDWSSDGKKIVFHQAPMGPLEILDLVRKKVTTLRDANGNYVIGSNPRWATDGRIVYGTEKGLDVWNADGRISNLLKARTNTKLTPLAWSPDESALAYVQYDYSVNPVFEISLEVVDRQGNSQVMAIFSNPGQASGGLSGDWSADGKHMYIIDLTNSLWKVNVESICCLPTSKTIPSPVLVRNLNEDSHSLDISRDGRWVVFGDLYGFHVAPVERYFHDD